VYFSLKQNFGKKFIIGNPQKTLKARGICKSAYFLEDSNHQFPSHQVSTSSSTEKEIVLVLIHHGADDVRSNQALHAPSKKKNDKQFNISVLQLYDDP